MRRLWCWFFGHDLYGLIEEGQVCGRCYRTFVPRLVSSQDSGPVGHSRPDATPGQNTDSEPKEEK